MIGLTYVSMKGGGKGSRMYHYGGGGEPIKMEQSYEDESETGF